MENNERLYNLFLEIIAHFDNSEIMELTNSLIEYVKGDEEL